VLFGHVVIVVIVTVRLSALPGEAIQFNGDVVGLSCADPPEDVSCLPQARGRIAGAAEGHGTAAQAGQRAGFVAQAGDLAG